MTGIDSYNKYNIYLVDLMYEEGTGSKVRPVLQIDEDEYAVLISKITSHGPRSNFKREYVIQDWREAGLNKPSTIRLSSITPVDKDALIRKIGHLSERDSKAVDNILSKIEEQYVGAFNNDLFTKLLSEELDEQIKVIFKCSLYQGNSLKPANLENIDLDAALRSVIVKDIRNFIDKFNIANNLNLENESDWTRFSVNIDDTNLENTKLVKINLFDGENNTNRAKELLDKSGDFSNSMILLDNEDNYHTFTIVYRIVEVS